MLSKTPAIDWGDILNELHLYKGTIADFCRENNIKPHQLYYYRKKGKNNKNELNSNLKEDEPTIEEITYKRRRPSKNKGEKDNDKANIITNACFVMVFPPSKNSNQLSNSICNVLFIPFKIKHIASLNSIFAVFPVK